MAKMRKVRFARINRRSPAGQETLAMRTFAEDFTELASSRLTQTTQRGTGGQLLKTWTAADMTIDANGDFMTGTLGFSSPEDRKVFNTDAWSWVKGETVDLDAASRATVAPFAVDLHESHRWVAFAPTAKIRPGTFAWGLEHVLNQAVVAAGLIPTEWEVDLVVSRSEVDEWIRKHPLIHFMRRTIKIPNPGRELDSDRAEMRSLAAQKKTEEFVAQRGGLLDTASELFADKLDGTQTGDVELQLHAHRHNENGIVKFNSRSAADEELIDDFGVDLMLGMELVLAALQLYVRDRQ
jgi:hypothetical protein